MTAATSTPDTLTSFQHAVIDQIHIQLNGALHEYAAYIALSPAVRGNDEANAVDQQFARFVLEWLGFTSANWSYNLPQVGQKANRPDYLVNGSIGTAFIWEDKNSTLDLEDEHVQQMRRYSVGTAGYAVWCNMRRILAVRFNPGDAIGYEKLADIQVAGLFGSQRLLANEQAEQVTQLELLHLLFGKRRFTQFAELVGRVAIDEETWRQHAQPLVQPEAIAQFIANSRESLNHVRLAALGQIRDALTRRTSHAAAQSGLRAEWDAAREKLIDVLSYETVRQPVRAAIENLEQRLGELENRDLQAVWLIVERYGNASRGSSLRPNFEMWLERAVRVNSALLALRFGRGTSAAVGEAYRVWSERQSDQEDVRPEIFAEQVAYVFFVRLLLVRVLEDKGVLQPRLASDGGFREWTAYIKHRFRELDGISILNETYAQLLTRKAEQYYLHFFQQGVFNWFLPDDFLFVETLEFLCRYDFAEVANDIIGFTYEEYIDRTARNRKGHFLTRDEVVGYMLDLLGYVGNDMIGRSLLDPASGSGSFLVHAARRYRLALVAAACAEHGVVDEQALPPEARRELARQFIDALTTQFYGIELNPFACYLAEMNLLIQSLNDLSLLNGAGEHRAIERFAIFNSDSLDLPREVLDSDNPGSRASLLAIPDRLSDRLFDEAYPLKARLHGYGQGFFFVISNPPYVTSKREKSLDAERFRASPFYGAALSGDTNLYLLFLRLGLYYLADYGRMLFIQPLTLFGDSSASAARRMLATPPFSVAAAIRFYRGDVLFPGVDQAVGIVLVQRDLVPTAITISGGETVAQARAAHTSALPASVLQAVPTDNLWQGNWLVCDDPAILAVWQHVKRVSNTLDYRLKTLLDATFDIKQGDVNATYTNDLRVGETGSVAQGHVALYKGENVDPFMPLPAQPSDWARVLRPSEQATKEVTRSSQILAGIKAVSKLEYGIVLRETARLNTRERLKATWFERDATNPKAFEHTLWRMSLKTGISVDKAKALLALLNSSPIVYLLNLFSTNNHVTRDELDRLPIPDPVTFPAAVLAALAEQALTARAALEHYVEAYGALLPETPGGDVYLPPSAIVAAWTGPKLTLGALRTRGLVNVAGATSSKVRALRQRNLVRYTGTDTAVAAMISSMLDEPARGDSIWAAADGWLIPDPIAISAWQAHAGGLTGGAQALWQQFTATQQQIDSAIMDWYGFDAAMRAAIMAGLPWARRRVAAPAVALPPLNGAAPTGLTTRTVVRSSNIYAIGYDVAAQVLEVEFNDGSLRQYKAVSVDVWQQFAASASKGTFYSKKIKGRFASETV